MTDFLTIQRDFIAHLKDPDQHAFDYGIEDRRMGIYRELFFNNIKGFLDSGFPVLSSLYSEHQWIELVRNFFVNYQCRSPFFIDISKEFVEFLSNEYRLRDSDPSFLQELAHYEWLELDVSVRKGTLPQLSSNTEFPDEIAMSPLAELVSYQYPVHQVSEHFQPEQPSEPVFIVVYRDADDIVQFTLLNQASAYLLNQIQQHEAISVATVKSNMCQAMPHLASQQVIQGTHQTLQQFLSQQILVQH